MIRQPKCACAPCADSFSPKATAALETFLWNSTRIRSRGPLPIQSESPLPEAGTGIPIFRFRTGQATLSRFTRLSCFDHYPIPSAQVSLPFRIGSSFGREIRRGVSELQSIIQVVEVGGYRSSRRGFFRRCFEWCTDGCTTQFFAAA